MTCIRPPCTRPRDRGVHCRKCHRRWTTHRHNVAHAHPGRPWEYPAHAPRAFERMVDGVLAETA